MDTFLLFWSQDVCQGPRKDALFININRLPLRYCKSFEDSTGCSNLICAKKTHFLAIKNVLLSHKNGICTFMRCGHLTYDPWIWLKVTSMASTASNRKSAKTPYNSGFLIIHATLRDQYW